MNLYCIFLRIDCAALELPNKSMMNQTSRRFEISTTAFHSNNGHIELFIVHNTSMNGQYMDEDFPLDIDLVLFPLVNGAIYLKAAKGNKVIVPLGHNLQISHKSHKQLETAVFYGDC